MSLTSSLQQVISALARYDATVHHLGDLCDRLLKHFEAIRRMSVHRDAHVRSEMEAQLFGVHHRDLVGHSRPLPKGASPAERRAWATGLHARQAQDCSAQHRVAGRAGSYDQHGLALGHPRIHKTALKLVI